MTARCSMKGPFVRCSQAQVKQSLSKAWSHLNLHGAGPGHAYRLRHGGASWEIHMGLRPLLDVQVRGRWASVHCLKRYQKDAAIKRVMEGLTASQLRQCNAAETTALDLLVRALVTGQL
eukprot:3873044-Amphidinium_carterae.1